jgi:hypothetical protein
MCDEEVDVPVRVKNNYVEKRKKVVSKLEVWLEREIHKILHCTQNDKFEVEWILRRKLLRMTKAHKILRYAQND